MKELIDEVRRAVDGECLLAAVMCALTIPDIAGALEANNGQASRKRYVDWFDKHVQTHRRDAYLSGSDCYRFRCSLLHQGSTRHPRNSYGRIVMLEPDAGKNIFHNNVIQTSSETVLAIHAPTFCIDMADRAENWWASASNDPTVQGNYSAFVRRYPNGVPGYIVGGPAIC